MKLLLFVLLLTNASLSFAMLVKLPSAKILNERFSKEGLDHFIEKTNIVNQLADQEKKTAGIVVAVEFALFDYLQYMDNPAVSFLMEMRKEEIYQIILKDNPEVLKEVAVHYNLVSEKKKKLVI